MTELPESEKLLGADALRAILMRHISGVCVVTTCDESGNPFGFTASSVTSLGSNPPLLSLNVSRSSSTYPLFKNGQKVAVHTLGESNISLAERLAGPKEFRFDGSEAHGPGALPIFREATGVLLCDVTQKFEVHSNAIVVLQVSSGFTLLDASPLGYHERRYRHFSE